MFFQSNSVNYENILIIMANIVVTLKNCIFAACVIKNVMPRITRFLITLLAVCILLISCKPDNQRVNHNYMWFDCESNYSALSTPDSILCYLEKYRDLGFGNVVVGMKVFGSLNIFAGGHNFFGLCHIRMYNYWNDIKKAFDEYLKTVKYNLNG